MSIFEIISGALLMLSSVIIVIVVLLQEHKKADLSNSITGGSSSFDSYYGRNKGRTREERLKRLTLFSAILFFVLTLAVNVFAVYL